MAGIYAIQSDGQLVEMLEQRYDSEDLLQGLLAQYPSLLAGDQIDPTSPRRWALVSREAPVPGQEGGSDRWAIDNLFLDQDAVPTIVEVKRSTDTRIRREVVGQMLDYAANAVVYWPIERLRTMFELLHGDQAERVLAELQGTQSEVDSDSFWQQVKTNLQAGRVRLVFVADLIPPELRRVVEFLNAQMDPAQVIAVEIRQYVGPGLKTMVPRVIGLTAEAEQKKRAGSGRQRRQWDVPQFMQTLTDNRGETIAEVASRILGWTASRPVLISWGTGAVYGNATLILDRPGPPCRLVVLGTAGTVQVPFGFLKMPPFNQELLRGDLRRRLNAIAGVALPEGQGTLNGYPEIPMERFSDPELFGEFRAVLDWMVDQYQAELDGTETGV